MGGSIHLGKTQMRFQAAMEAIVHEMVVKPLLRGFAKSRAREATCTALGHYYDQMVATSRCPADPVFDAPPGDILIRTGNASYPAWVLH